MKTICRITGWEYPRFAKLRDNLNHLRPQGLYRDSYSQATKTLVLVFDHEKYVLPQLKPYIVNWKETFEEDTAALEFACRHLFYKQGDLVASMEDEDQFWFYGHNPLNGLHDFHKLEWSKIDKKIPIDSFKSTFDFISHGYGGDYNIHTSLKYGKWVKKDGMLLDSGYLDISAEPKEGYFPVTEVEWEEM